MLSVFFLKHAVAQHSGSNRFPDKSAADLFQLYKKNGTGKADNPDLLIDILNKHLPATDSNLDSLRESLAATKIPEEKILLAKILTSMYSPRLRNEQNLKIESDIKGLISSADAHVAREAVFEYCRMNSPPDRHQVLQRARAAKIIGEDAYYGELAHGLRFSSSEEQSQMIAELEVAHNEFANGILASTFANQRALLQLQSSVQLRLLNLLSNSEPNFPLALDNFGLVDAAKFTIWIDAVASIDSTINGKPYAQLVVGRLSAPRVDPRKILAVFSNPEGVRVINESSDVGQLRVLFSRAQAFGNSLPQNLMLRGALATFSGRLSAKARTGLQ
jgi:hypothetical protein